MVDFKAMYSLLFNSITQVIEILQKAQQVTEDMFIESDDPKLEIRYMETSESEEDDEPK